MAKKSRPARKSASTASRRPARSTSQGLSGTFDGVTTSMKRMTNDIPSSAFYWGLGAVALSAAAVGAYMYRGRIMSAYSTAVESIEAMAEEYMQSEDDSTESEGETLDVSRKSKSANGLSQPAKH